jgi:hypothetical protein
MSVSKHGNSGRYGQNSVSRGDDAADGLAPRVVITGGEFIPVDSTTLLAGLLAPEEVR